MSTYSTNAAICAKFYALSLNADHVSDFVFNNSNSKIGNAALFVGSMYQVAAGLISKGINLTAVDYSQEMVEIGMLKLPGVKVETADLRDLPYEGVFDVVFVIGRVFTHMITDDDLSLSLTSCWRALKSGGRLFFDNYEDSKIQKTNYFNGVVKVKDGDTSITRTSSTTKISDSPFVVRWDAEYSGMFEGKNFLFADSMEHRAFSRQEIAKLLASFGFEVLEQKDNFDETSFCTLALAV